MGQGLGSGQLQRLLKSLQMQTGLGRFEYKEDCAVRREATAGQFTVPTVHTSLCCGETQLDQSEGVLPLSVHIRCED